MPRFYFNLRNDLSVDDRQGEELADVEGARERAVKYAVDMIAASVLEQRKINLHHQIEVMDESGERVLIVEYRDVVKIEG